MSTLKMKRLLVALIVAVSAGLYGAQNASADAIYYVTLTPGLTQVTNVWFNPTAWPSTLLWIRVTQKVTAYGNAVNRPISDIIYGPGDWVGADKMVLSSSISYHNSGIPLPVYGSAAYYAFWQPSSKTRTTYTYNAQGTLAATRTNTLSFDIAGRVTEMTDLNQSYDPTGLAVVFLVSKRTLFAPTAGSVQYDLNGWPIVSSAITSTITTTVSTPPGGIKSTSVQTQNALGVVTSHHLQQHTAYGKIIRDASFNLAAKQFVDQIYNYNVPGVNARLVKYAQTTYDRPSWAGTNTIKMSIAVDYRFDGKALRYEKVTYNAAGPANKLRYTLNRNTAGVVMSITVNEYTDYVNPANSFLNVVFRDIAVVSDEINGVPAINSPTLNTRMGLPQASQASAMPALTGDLVMMDQMLTLGQDEADCPNCQAPVGKEDLLKQA